MVASIKRGAAGSFNNNVKHFKPDAAFTADSGLMDFGTNIQNIYDNLPDDDDGSSIACDDLVVHPTFTPKNENLIKISELIECKTIEDQKFIL